MNIFECIIGSTAYGTNLPTSDVDIKGVYRQPNSDILGLKYQEQRNIDKDTTFYEVRRFIDLLGSANPTVLEMLFVDGRFIKHIDPSFQIIRDQRYKFLTKNCANSFGGYAVAQIKKAKGLNKKMNWEKERIERKGILDFCTVFLPTSGNTTVLNDWLSKKGFKHEYIGLTKLDKMPGCYGMYYDSNAAFRSKVADYQDDNYLGERLLPLGYRGIAGEDSNDVRLSSIPKNEICVGIMYFNKDAYSIHCKEYREYVGWLENRNESRYVDTMTAGQQIDSKNIMHCVRLIDCALEIAETGNLTVFRPNAAELLKIRKGECDLNEIIEQCEKKIAKMDELFKQSNLPDTVSLDFKHDLILQVRK